MEGYSSAIFREDGINLVYIFCLFLCFFLSYVYAICVYHAYELFFFIFKTIYSFCWLIFPCYLVFFLHFHLFLWLEYDNNSFSLYDLCINQTRWAKPYKFVFWSVQYVLNIIFIYQTSCIVRVIWLVFLQVSPKRS